MLGTKSMTTLDFPSHASSFDKILEWPANPSVNYRSASHNRIIKSRADKEPLLLAGNKLPLTLGLMV